MTQLLERAISEISKLPDTEQDALATILLEEMASEQRWADAFAKSQDMLADMASEALAEDASGKTRPM